MRVSFSEALGAAAICGLAGWVSSDLLAATCVGVLLVGLKLVQTGDRVYALAAGFSFHWLQTSLGVLYLGFTGREVPAIYSSDYRPMVLIALGCCLSMAVGIAAGMRLIARPDPDEQRPEYAFSFVTIAAAYLIMTSFEGVLTSRASDYPSIRQIMVTADSARLGLLFLLLRRFLRPPTRWTWVAGIVLFEVLLGFTGFFAGFREPVVLAAVAILEIFDRRNKRQWMALGAIGSFAVVLGVLWMAIRTDYRRDYVDMDNVQVSRSTRFNHFESLSSGVLHSDADAMWSSVDNLVDRMWAVYYPALAVERVPSMAPHTHGAILFAALVHIVTPRIFFPNKPDLQSDSEKVRKYSGIMVAGSDTDTSIAFGYAAEAYIDFGLPGMFVPVFFFGLAIGAAYSLFRKLIWHRELFVAFATVAFWLSTYLFERSWATMLGVSLGYMVYLGAPIVLLDRFLLVKHINRIRAEEGLMADSRLPSEVG